MKVSPEKPFDIIYSLFEHEYLGYMFESFAVQLGKGGRLSFSHQNISSKNAEEFSSKLDENDYELIRLMDSMQQDSVVNHFQRRKIKPQDFFLKVFDKSKGDKVLQNEIHRYMERRRKAICPLLTGKRLFEMGKDGEPTWKELKVSEEKATVLFHFYRNEDNTHYFPTIKLHGKKVDFYQNGSYLLAEEPAWIVVNNELFTFDKPINGKKIKPFFKKKFVVVPPSVEETYYQKFIAPLVASFDVHAKGFHIETKDTEPKPILTFSEIVTTEQSLFSKPEEVSSDKVLMELKFAYEDEVFQADKLEDVGVRLQKTNGSFSFKKTLRDKQKEKHFLSHLDKIGLSLKNSRATLDKNKAFDWLYGHKEELEEMGYAIQQHNANNQVYFLGKASIDISIEEGIDWFDIKSKIKFGPFEIPFSQIRKNILNKKFQIELPDGSLAVIPESWITEYADLFAFADEQSDAPRLNKMHLAVVKDLENGNHAQVAMTRKLERLANFEEIDSYDIPQHFKGELRSYQHAGYNWMRFLDEYGFGGCLADDMGLGKTVQTLALLQSEQEKNPGSANLLIMPTSLVYNWIMEARKFTPKMRILNYTGTQRVKDTCQFAKHDLVITSYGIARIDTNLLADYYFNYIILDESQAIKNPDSRIAKAVKQLKSRRKLILTGTPIENSTMDLWSQMAFVNPGLLGGKKFFNKNYQIPIEKKNDQSKTEKLNRLVKPFLLRREKSQVAKELPEKVENVRYCEMSASQREYYEKEKSAYRNQIFDSIEKEGLQKAHMLLLQGLTRLRQIANHPMMVDDMFEGDSGKFEDISYMIHNALAEHHKLLIFSQFVKHLHLVKAFLEKEDIPFAYLDGSTKDRQSQVERFQKDDNVNAFLISLKAGGLGLNLTNADYVFILDPWWNPAAEAQAVDRAHRIGQKQKVFTYKFIARDTVEEKILKLQEHKLKLAGDIVTIEDSFVKSLTADDISNLLA